MGRVVSLILLILVVVVVGGAIYLAMADVPAPTARVETTLPNEPSAP